MRTVGGSRRQENQEREDPMTTLNPLGFSRSFAMSFLSPED